MTVSMRWSDAVSEVDPHSKEEMRGVPPRTRDANEAEMCMNKRLFQEEIMMLAVILRDVVHLPQHVGEKLKQAFGFVRYY